MGSSTALSNVSMHEACGGLSSCFSATFPADPFTCYGGSGVLAATSTCAGAVADSPASVSRTPSVTIAGEVVPTDVPEVAKLLCPLREWSQSIMYVGW